MRQLDAVARQFLSALAAGTPLLPGAGVLAFIDMDSMQKRVYGHAKQGAGFTGSSVPGDSRRGPDRQRPAARSRFLHV